ncbi:MAG: excinuclease ABC subunit UvrC [Rhodospirillales bacterium]|nr:excinuclease ABC subunit UvrC [Rhodospirillales bacterium]
MPNPPENAAEPDGSTGVAETLPAQGAELIQARLATMPGSPGVYRMIGAKGDFLYVGKAKNLRKRITNYVHVGRLGPRLRRMVAETVALEIVTTHTEAEALLLEANLIKRHRPRYNIVLRDDKSLPCILVTADHAYPQVLKHRGAQSRRGDYFGPFASAWSVNRTLVALQRAFLLRSCSDAVFAARTRPCLLHQIKRCAAPCVGRIGEADYEELVEEARAFLRGDSQRIQQDLAQRMEAAAEVLDFEEAARYRDRIRALTAVQSHQDINLEGMAEADVVAAYQAGGQTCIEVFFFRAGCNYGNRAYFPSHAESASAGAVISAFLGQFYADRAPPPLILLSHPLPDQAIIAEALSVHAGKRVELRTPQRGAKANLVEHALANARAELGRRVAESASQRRLLEGLARALQLEAPPRRIEVFDNSHVSGTEAVGAMIVAGPEGLQKAAYRKFTIRQRDIAPGDDYAMMREVLTRRFSRGRRAAAERAPELEGDAHGAGEQWPDLVLIDGGPGQLAVGVDVFADLGIVDVALAAIAKGPDRNAGHERIYRPGLPPLSLEPRSPVLYFLQRLRDEAHRFAIGTHRARRSARLSRSTLDEIPGIGPHRKKALLHHFGSARAVSRAGRGDIEAVAGISRDMANKIYEWFHAER